ncbi:hypothetical protein Zmor_001093 [Zophobas morio]|uniref:Uncharacterized protein n=1 Tax=Zophobas morio TaxID=2755281 RepID=A0AA38MSE1_9CUCU|nr:hypothetical protein Zmor_001093 [Zophobas morio]
MSLAMPFIDNDLLWSSDHDGKMVDISSCLQDASVPGAQQNTTGMGLGELSQSDLSSLVPPLPEANIADNEDIFKHLSDTTSIEIDTLLNEFNSTPFIKQEENNNIPNCAADEASGNSATHQKSAQVMLEMRSLKYTIAAANPILAEKLATPSEQNIQPSNNGSRPQLAPLTPKVEKGRYLISVISCITCDRGKTV